MPHPDLFIIDRFEGERAVLEQEGRTYELPRSLLPADAREGDAVRLLVSRDAQLSEERARTVRALRDRLKGRDPGGDVEL